MDFPSAILIEWARRNPERKLSPNVFFPTYPEDIPPVWKFVLLRVVAVSSRLMARMRPVKIQRKPATGPNITRFHQNINTIVCSTKQEPNATHKRVRRSTRKEVIPQNIREEVGAFEASLFMPTYSIAHKQNQFRMRSPSSAKNLEILGSCVTHNSHPTWSQHHISGALIGRNTCQSTL